VLGGNYLVFPVSEATARFAAWLAPYRSPKLSAITIAAPSEIEEETSITVNIFNARDERLLRFIDGRERRTA
jgi:hypothetical protein